MRIGLPAAVIGCVFALLGATAVPAKPLLQKSATAKPANTAKPVNDKTVRRLPGTVSQEPPPGVRVQPPLPGPAGAPPRPAAKKTPAKPAPKAQTANAPKAPAEAKAKPAPKSAAKKDGAKKKAAKKKDEPVRSGRAALSAMAGVDANQVSADHLKGAETKSSIELLSSYKDTVRDGDLETAAILLRLASGQEPDREAVNSINDLIGVTLDTQDTDALIDIAKGRRASAVMENLGGSVPDSPSQDGAASRIDAAHAVVAALPRRSAIMALANYKRAVAENNREAAALALAAASGGAADTAAEAQANALLDIGEDETAAE